MKKRIIRFTSLILVLVQILSLFGCSVPRTSDFKTLKEASAFFNGTWQRESDKTYIIIKAEVCDYEKDGQNWSYLNIDISTFAFPAKPNWSDISGVNLFQSLKELQDNSYYCSDNEMDIALLYNVTDRIFSCFSLTEDDITIGEKHNVVDVLDNHLIVNDNDTISINDEVYSFVSSDTEWFFKQTKKYWKTAVKNTVKERKEYFNKFKASFCDKTRFEGITLKPGDIISLYSCIHDSYNVVKGSAYYNDDVSRDFFSVLGYFSTLEKNTDAYRLSQIGWSAAESLIYEHDYEKSAEIWEDFRKAYNESALGSIIPIQAE